MQFLCRDIGRGQTKHYDGQHGVNFGGNTDMGKVRIKISSDSITEVEVSPLWSGEFVRKIERDRIYHTHEVKGALTFVGAEFSLINDLTNECEKITITIERWCTDAWVLYFTGEFSKFDCAFDLFKCTCQAKITTADKYACIGEEWEDEENIYDNTGDAIITREFYGNYESSLDSCFECRATPDISTPVCTNSDACEEVTELRGGELPYTYICPPPLNFVITFFHRVTAEGTPTTPPPFGTGWTLLSGSTWWRCLDVDEAKIGVLRWGRSFNQCLALLFAVTSCGMIVRSHFFGLNATHAAPPDNDEYTFATDYLQHLSIHQKSDVKRPDGNPSFSYVWKMKLKDLLADLQTMFNVFWKIEAGEVIIEHISYFEAAAGADYSTRTLPLQLAYEGDTPKTETYKFADEDCSDFFKGLPIEYNCGVGTKDHRVSLFSTDLVFISDEGNQDKVNDDKFVLISNFVDGGMYFINDKNNPLSWTTLHDKLHRRYRPFSSGKLNGTAVTFDSVQPLKKQPEFTVPFCCDTDSDPADYVVTQLGNGHVQTQTENIYKDFMKLQLNYE